MILILVVLFLLTGVYALTVASFAWEDLVTGLGLAIVLVAIFRRAILPDQLQSPAFTVKAIVYFPIYVAVVIRTVVVGAITVAAYVLGIRELEHPGIVAVPMGERSQAGVAVSELALTLSPGSFIVENNWDERMMYVHVLDASDPEEVRADLQAIYDRYQRHVVP